MREKRTETNFDKHVLTITKQKDLTVYDFSIPGQHTHSIKFINTLGIMAITGDYGNWIFCREFHPDIQSVSDMYWIEKLQLASTQNPYVFDSNTAKEEAQQLLDDKDFDFSEEERDWLESMKRAADGGEYEYIAEAMNRPGSFEAERIPKGKIYNYWILVIFDAFDEISRRINIESNPVKEDSNV